MKKAKTHPQTKQLQRPEAGRGGVIRIEPELAGHFDYLQLSLLRAGLPSGYRGVTAKALIYYAVMRWTDVSQGDIKELVTTGEQAKAGFVKSLSAESRAAAAGEKTEDDKRPFAIPDRHDFDARLAIIISKFKAKGVGSGRFLANRNTIIRQALRRWREVVADDVEGFEKQASKIWK